MRPTATLLRRAAIGACTLMLSLGALAQEPPAATAASANAPAPQSVESSDQNVPPAVAHKQAAEIARGDPARWSREDFSDAARVANLRKEIGAALQESQGACRSQPKAERAACMKQARDTYQQDMAALRAQIAAGR